MSISPQEMRIGNARGSESRGRSFAAASLCKFNGRDFGCDRAEGPVAGRGPWASYDWRDDGLMLVICPTCQNVFAGIAQRPEQATLHGVVFDIFVARPISGIAKSRTVRPPPPARPCAWRGGVRLTCHHPRKRVIQYSRGGSD